MKRYLAYIFQKDKVSSMIEKSKFYLGEVTNKGYIIDIIFTLSTCPDTSRISTVTNYLVLDKTGSVSSHEERHLKTLEN